MPITLDGTNGVTTNSGTLISATTIGVGGATPSTSGAGITFPATQSASTDANTLDDYEEGTFTPTIGNFTLTSGTLGFAARYTKIGRQVTINVLQNGAGNVNWSAGSYLTGLPFAPIASEGGTVGVYSNSGPSLVGVVLPWTDNNIYFNPGQTGQSRLIFSATYFTS